VFSFRDANHQWNPKQQRPELWQIYNGEIDRGESVRAFPLSNWTELDVWQYIMLENIDLVPLYFSAQRLSWIDESSGQILALDDERMLPYLNPNELKTLKKRQIRFRTLGCYPQTGAIESQASCVQDILGEMLVTRQSERQGRLLDQDQAGSMELKKREGYF
jgi:sulfate adenylyltransferase subunit 2